MNKQHIRSPYPAAHFYTQDRLAEFTSIISTVSSNTLIIIKNIELFDEDTFQLVQKHSKLIISGDIGMTHFKTKLLHHMFATKIYFSELDSINLPPLEKYSGYVESGEYKGITKIA